MTVCGAGVIRENITWIKKDLSFQKNFCFVDEPVMICPHFGWRQEKEKKGEKEEGENSGINNL
ncbi:MAG: hypothetical protein Q7R92_02965 [bacterium]|nr:hypothetical protein [bacterium]